jgi:hypothetical protein
MKKECSANALKVVWKRTSAGHTNLCATERTGGIQDS